MIMRGKIAWAKVLGQPKKGYNEGEREWSVDFEPDEKSLEKYLANGGSDFYLKTKENHPLDGQFIAFKRKEKRQDGSDAKPITVKDAKGNDWDPSVKLGNGTLVDVKVALNEIKAGGKTRLKPGLIAIRVLDLVEYEGAGDEDREDFNFDDDDWS